MSPSGFTIVDGTTPSAFGLIRPRLGEERGEPLGDGNSSGISKLGDTGRNCQSDGSWHGDVRPYRAAGWLSSREGLTVGRVARVRGIVAVQVRLNRINVSAAAEAKEGAV